MMALPHVTLIPSSPSGRKDIQGDPPVYFLTEIRQIFPLTL